MFVGATGGGILVPATLAIAPLLAGSHSAQMNFSETEVECFIDGASQGVYALDLSAIPKPGVPYFHMASNALADIDAIHATQFLCEQI